MKDSKKENKDAKKEDKELNKKEKSLKKDEKNLKKDSIKAKAFKAMHPVEAAKMAISKPLKILKMKIMIIIGAICIGLFLIFFIIEVILGALMDAFGNIDEALTGVANFYEKLDNMYRGFGFEDSEQAFYDELNRLCEKYNDNLDVTLLLSTIFYTESMEGYDTDYSLIESVADPTVSGSNGNVLNSIRSYAAEKFDERHQTVSEEGLVYNVGKIYRLRKLARNQFSTGLFGLTKREGQILSASLTDFLTNYGGDIASDIADLFKACIRTVVEYFTSAFNELWAKIVGSEYSGTFFDDAGLATEDLVASFKDLLSDVFYGIVCIEKVDISLTKGITVYYSDYVFDEENYDAYLKNYYIEYMPEFQDILPASGTEQRDFAKEQIIDQIYENKELFEDIYMQNVSTSSESYASSCVGAIDNTLISELVTPVDIAEGTTVNFSEEYAYGMVDGKVHKGVDLNSSTTGSNEADNVYSIANGTVEELNTCENSTDDSCSDGAYIIIGHTVIIDSNEYKFKSVYKHLDKDSITLTENSVVSKGAVIGKIGGSSSGYTEAYLHFEFRNDDTAIDPTNLFIPCSSSVELTGDTNEEKIWNWLLSQGYTKIAASGIMGNWMQESGFLSNNLENGANTRSGMSDEEFTAAVDNGSISRTDFISSSRFGIPKQSGTSYDGLKYGYGLAQWTDPGRKGNLYDFWKSYGSSVSIGDLGMQLGFYLDEASGYSTLDSKLNSSTSPEEAAKVFVNIYEVGTASETRQKNARSIYNKYANQ